VPKKSEILMTKKNHETKLLDELESGLCPRLFEITDSPFTRHHIDDFRSARDFLNVSTHNHF